MRGRSEKLFYSTNINLQQFYEIAVCVAQKVIKLQSLSAKSHFYCFYVFECFLKEINQRCS